jgi:MoaA/NifB/PqqE/SkfB family radical SAM enzyme
VEQLREEGYEVNIFENFIDRMTATKEEYISQRNLLFIVKAMQYAEVVGIKKIYIAVIDPEKEEGRFVDTSPEFIAKMNEVAKLSGIEILAPFVNMNKWDVFLKSREYGIDLDSTWSCNFPTQTENGLEECGECGNCKLREAMYTPVLAWADDGLRPGKRFERAVMKQPVTEVRMLINDKCNTQCKHCFYGDYHVGSDDALTYSKWMDFMCEAAQYGITNFHFAGKEPFYDDGIFKFTYFIKNMLSDYNVTYDAVTNGINVKKYINEIVDAGFSRVCVSFDDRVGGRTREKTSIGYMEELINHEVPTAAFITLTNSNKNNIMKNIEYLDKIGVSEFCVNPIRYIGSARNIKDELVKGSDILKLFLLLKEHNVTNKKILFKVPSYLVEQTNKLNNVKWNQAINEILTYDHWMLNDNVEFSPELFCHSYLGNVTITPDGFVLGCGMEVASKYIDSPMAVSIRNYSFADIIEHGKRRTVTAVQLSMQDDKCDLCFGGCFHQNYCKELCRNNK